MAVIKKFKVLKMACFLGLFGIFTGLILGIAAGILTLFIPILYDYAIWQMILGVTIANGVLMFITGLIFAPLINLSLKIIKGLHLDIDLAKSVPLKGLVSTASTKKSATKSATKPIPIRPVRSAKDSKPLSQMTNVKTTGKPIPIHPTKSARDSRPLSQMTNVKTTAQKPTSTTPVKPIPTRSERLGI